MNALAVWVLLIWSGLGAQDAAGDPEVWVFDNPATCEDVRQTHIDLHQAVAVSDCRESGIIRETKAP